MTENIKNNIENTENTENTEKTDNIEKMNDRNGINAPDTRKADGQDKTELLSLSLDEVRTLVAELGEPKYRAEQLYVAMNRGIAPENITNIPKAMKAKLADAAYYHVPEIAMRLVSAIDGTRKYLLRLCDGNCIEAVLMKYNHGNTICVSSQVGCRMGCRFCASTIGGKVRDLTAGEILGEVIAVQNESGERVSNIVMMGIGEPLDNYDNVVKFLHLVNAPEGLNIGYRHISLSTCGVVPGIRKLAQEELPITLSISLHAPDDKTRSEIMPINRSYCISELMSACREYYRESGRRISFEYTLISGKNDSEAAARSLAGLLNGSLRPRGNQINERNGNGNKENMPIHVNLIPVNDVTESGFVRSDQRSIDNFAKVLESKGIRATVRRRLGPDINASCGQLRRSRANENEADKP